MADAVTGDPVPNAWVAVYGVTSGPTGDEGVFETGELAAGSYFGDVAADGYQMTSFDAYVDGATSITVPLQPSVPGTLMIKVVSMGTGDPIAGATVVIYNSNGHVYVTEGTTGEEGFFSVTLPGGGYDVEVDAPGFIPTQ